MSSVAQQDYSYSFDVSCSVRADEVCAIALQAGDAIMKVYEEEGDSLVRKKDDPTESPLTRADLAANEVIVGALRSLYPHIPIVTEEQKADEQSYEEYRRKYQCFFCVVWLPTSTARSYTHAPKHTHVRTHAWRRRKERHNRIE